MNKLAELFGGFAMLVISLTAIIIGVGVVIAIFSAISTLECAAPIIFLLFGLFCVFSISAYSHLQTPQGKIEMARASRKYDRDNLRNKLSKTSRDNDDEYMKILTLSQEADETWFIDDDKVREFTLKRIRREI